MMKTTPLLVPTLRMYKKTFERMAGAVHKYSHPLVDDARALVVSSTVAAGTPLPLVIVSFCAGIALAVAPSVTVSNRLSRSGKVMAFVVVTVVVEDSVLVVRVLVDVSLMLVTVVLDESVVLVTVVLDVSAVLVTVVLDDSVVLVTVVLDVSVVLVTVVLDVSVVLVTVVLDVS